MKKLLSVFALLSVILCSVLVGCKEKKHTPPALPVEASILMDFSNFVPDSKSSTKGIYDTHWSFVSDIITGAWMPLVDTYLDPIQVQLHSLLSGTLSDQGGNTWLLGTSSSSLRAVVGSTNVEWTLTANNVILATGTTNTEATSGQWLIKQSSGSTIMKIDWSLSGQTLEQLKYTYLLDGAYQDSYITWQNSAQSTAYDQSYVILHKESINYNVNVEWNSTNKSGRVQCQEQFSDTNWYSWNSDYMNN